jgi:hypothetical protein
VRLIKRLLRPLAILVLSILFFAITAASPSQNATQTATTIAAAIVAASPFLLPILLKVVPLTGIPMVVVAYAVSVLVVAIAMVTAGLFNPFPTTAPAMLLIGTFMFGLVQLVYNIFKVNHTFGLKLARYVA